MSDNSYGEVLQLDNFTYRWNIPGFRYINGDGSSYNLISPSFEYDGITRCLHLNNFEKGDHEIRCNISLSKTNCHIYYRIYIKNAEDREYYATEIFSDWANDMKRARVPGKYLGDVSKFQKDMDIIAPTGDLSLYVEFDPKAKLILPPTMAARANEASSLSTSVTPTSPNLQPGQSGSLGTEHTENLTGNLKDLFLGGQYSDVSVNVKGTVFNLHKAILAARSSVFAKQFLEGMMDIKMNCPAEVCREFFQYLYSSKIENLTMNNAVELCCMAETYDVTPLAAACIEFMLHHDFTITVDTFCHFVSLAVKKNDQRLLQSADKFFIENKAQIMSTQDWIDFQSKNVDAAKKLLNKASAADLKAVPESTKSESSESDFEGSI